MKGNNSTAHSYRRYFQPSRFPSKLFDGAIRDLKKSSLMSSFRQAERADSALDICSVFLVKYLNKTTTSSSVNFFSLWMVERREAPVKIEIVVAISSELDIGLKKIVAKSEKKIILQ